MEVSLENYRRNYRAIKERVKRRVIAVLKADSYGMGVVPVAWALKSEGADFFAVATPDEALRLRSIGIPDPILVLGSSPYEAAREYVRNGIRAAITDHVMAEEMSKEAVREKRAAYVHLKIDSGMGRIGFLHGSVREISSKLRHLPGVEVEGVFTHFATADEADLSHTHSQFKSFMNSLDVVREEGLNPSMVHCCNSAAILADLSDMFCDAVRPGHIISGLIPTLECGRAVKIEPCFEVKTAIGAIRELPAGMGISYGLTYTTDQTTRTAILPVGYADGYNRNLSNKGDVLIRGKRCRILGRVCMDQCMVNISGVPEAEPGDEVVLIGRQGDDAITIEEYAEKAGVITAMVPVMFTSRVPRVYAGNYSAASS
jgi:alanine racemase